MKNKKKILELFAKQLNEGLPFAEDFIDITPNIEQNALIARNLSEDALAHQVLKNTGIPIPEAGANKSKREDFLNQIVAERYPEFKDPNLRIGNEDSYFKNKILVNDRPDDLTAMVGQSLHEAGHKYDDKILRQPGINLDLADLRKAKASGIDLKNMDPAQVYELYAKNHHAKIPNFREGSYGLGALKSMMKSGTFKQIAGALPLVGGLVAGAMSEDASAAIPGLDQESLGESPEQEREIFNEINARKAYDASPARKARLDALKKFGK